MRISKKIARKDMSLSVRAEAEFQSPFVIDFDDFANKTGYSQSFWTLFLWPNYM